MNSKRILLIAFLLVALVQLAIPVKMIWDREEILDHGTLYKFRTAPVDPNDPFRGKYIALTFRDNIVEIADGEEWIDEEPIYITLTTDSNGFAKIDFVSKEMPSGQQDVIRAKVRYVMDEKPRKVIIDYPFDRFYMEESKAMEAEILYRQLSADTSRIAYALVSIKNGEAVLSDVLIDGTSIIDRINKQKEKSKSSFQQKTASY